MSDLIHPLIVGAHVVAACLALRLARVTGGRLGPTLLALGIVVSSGPTIAAWIASAPEPSTWLLDPSLTIALRGAGGVLLCAGAWQLRRHLLEVRRHEILFEEVFTGAADPMYLTDTKGRIVAANSHAEDLTGYSRSELLRMTLRELTPAEHVGGWNDHVAEAVARGAARHERVHRRRDGSKVHVDVAARRVSVHGETLVHAIARDLTARNAAADALRESERRYVGLFDRSPIGVYRSTPDGRVLLANPALRQILGCKDDADLDAINLETHARSAGYDRREFREAVERLGEVRGLETLWRQQDGTEIAYRENACVVRDEQGRVVAYEGTIEDITDRKRLEVQSSQAQRMQTVGRLAGGIAHEFNNLLTSVIGYGNLLAEGLGSDHPQHASAEHIVHAGQRAAELTRQLLAFSRREVVAPQGLDLNAVVTATLPALRDIMGKGVDVATSLQPGMLGIQADAAQIEQVLTNLAVNARDAMPAGGRLTIRTATVEVEDDDSGPAAGRAPAGCVLLSVSDTGVGMDAATQAHLFEPFFTTKDVGRGTGLGLATAYGIVEESGGHIGVDSEPGRGTTFWIYLPLARAEGSARTTRPDRAAAEPQAPEPGAASTAAGPAERRAATILVVDDDGDVRALTRDVLLSQGHKVLTAESGIAALDLAASHPRTIDLLLTDLVMPEMNGLELHRTFRREFPGTRTLYMSGYAADDTTMHGVREDGVTLLRKPFTPAELALVVRIALAASPVSHARTGPLEVSAEL